jgi:hypothetical protein
MQSSRSDAADLVEPPMSPETVSVMALIGTGLCGIAALGGGFDTTNPQFLGARVILTIIGMIISGAAIAQNPSWFGVWFFAALTCLVAVVGFPQSWDSFRFAAGVFAGVAAFGGVILLVPFYPRLLIVAFVVILHFGAIMTAVTAPAPSPWIGQQIWARYSRPYLLFTYMNNAYQFYSPDPGPATELWFLIEYEYEADDAINAVAGAMGQSAFDLKHANRWYKMPKRPSQVLDPFSLTYFRKLSLTEYASHASPNVVGVTPSADVQARRIRALPPTRPSPGENLTDKVPYNPSASVLQYFEPTEEVKRSIIPSYVRHVGFEFRHPSNDLPAKIKGIKLFRVQHRIISLEQFVGTVPDEYTPWHFSETPQPGKSIYDPRSYLPYYMGEYDTNGELKDRNDPLIYWVVSILPKYEPGDPPPKYASVRQLSIEEYRKYYHDYVEVYTGVNHHRQAGD